MFQSRLAICSVLSAVGLALPSEAHALAITAAACVQQATNTLRFDCTVTVDGAADVWVGFCEDPGAPCTYDRETPHVTLTAAGTATVTMYGMAEVQAYDWRGSAKQGATLVHTARNGITTGALPNEMVDIAFATWGTPDGVNNWLLTTPVSRARTLTMTGL